MALSHKKLWVSEAAVRDRVGTLSPKFAFYNKVSEYTN